MEAYLIYIGKAAIAAGTFYLLYLALFQHQKHFVFNRIYLPVSLALSFLIPLFTFTTVKYIDASIAVDAKSFVHLPQAMEVAAPEFVYQWYHYLAAIYAIGIFGFLFHLVLGHVKALNIIRYSRLKELFGAQVNVSPKDIHPFSFFNRIVLSERTLDNPNLEVIINHELIHVKERHTLDILFAEILFLLQWFNPFAWLIKDAMRNNLEYLTDDQITKNNNAEAYQLAMVGLAHKKGVAPFLTALNGSQLKNRIIMMKKKTENKYALLKQLVVLPLLAVLIMGLSNKQVKTEIDHSKNEIKIVVDGEMIPNDHPNFGSVNFRESFDGGEVIQALGISNKVVSNTLLLDEDPSCGGVYYIQTIDYEEGSNPDFEYLVSGEQSRQKRMKDYHVLNNSNVISGKIKDQHSDLPIKGASAQIDDLGKASHSDKEGNYQIQFEKNVKPLQVRVSAVGYHTNTVVYYGKDSELNVTLTPLEKNSSEASSERTIKGKVSNERGEPIAATSVLIKGSQTGTITNANGEYELRAEEEITELVFVMPGYKTQVVAVESKKTLDVNLKRNNYANKNEVVVLDEGDQKDKSVRIELSSDTENPPLYFIDGKEVASIENLDPESIDKITVLKDKQAENLYGKRAKNGVLLIETKAKKKFDASDKMVIVDGKEYKGDINAIDPNDISSIEVRKSQGDQNIYDDKGPEKDKIIIHTKTKYNSLNATPLIVIDGVIKGKNSNFEEVIDSEDVESISVLKGESATALYGKEAAGGAILITSKKENKEIITDELELRKFIAKRIKYPKDAMEAGITGTVSVHAKVDKYGELKIGKKTYPEKRIGEVVVTGYKPEVKAETEDPKALYKSLEQEAERIIKSIHSIHMDEVKNSSVVFTIKFVLQ